MATMDEDLPNTWKQLLPNSEGYCWKRDDTQGVTVVAKGLLLRVYFGKRSSKMSDCYLSAEVCDLELVQENQPKAERGELFKELQSAAGDHIFERW